jgi:hypothetical protein
LSNAFNNALANTNNAASSSGSSQAPLFSADHLARLLRGENVSAASPSNTPATNLHEVLNAESIISSGILNDPNGNIAPHTYMNLCI